MPKGVYFQNMSILESLNERQREAVLTTSGPILIVAGAGSGKTKTIAHRIAYLVSRDVAPDRILAVTFTNKAALEMKERVTKLLTQEGLKIAALGPGPEGSEPFVGTFHALGVAILRRYGSRIGVSRNFNILDEEDSRQVIKDLVREFELDPDVYQPSRMRSIISRFKNELVDASSFAREQGESPFQKNLSLLYAAYEMRLEKSHNLDFDDLLVKTVHLLESIPEIRDYYQNRWEYIHIDEYQDTNLAQYKLSRLLAEKHMNITAVGDIDQAIYSWRGADWRNILQFEQDWPGTKVILLEENYRSVKIILEAANAVISRNKERKEKNLWTRREGGERIRLSILEDEKREALFVAEYIQHLKKEGIPAHDIAVLFRTNAQSRALEEAFLHKKIPYRLYSGVKFYERKEIKDVLAYLKYALNPGDIVSKKRILNVPARGIGKVLTLKYIGGAELAEKDAAKIRKFERLIEKIRSHTKTTKASGALKTLLKDAGFEEYYKGNKLEIDRKENIEELISVAKKFDLVSPPEGIERLLTEAALMSKDTEIPLDDSEVVLLTAHAAKGLEFRIVIIAGMEEGLFPHILSETEGDLEEERRLFYVALTRAKEKVHITLTRKRMLYGEVSFNEPSRFIYEIPEHLIENQMNGYEYEENKISIE